MFFFGIAMFILGAFFMRMFLINGRSVVMFFIGIAIFILGLLGTMYLREIPFSMLANPSVLVMLLAAILATLTATNGFKLFGQGFRGAMFPNTALPDESRGRAASLFRLLSKITAMSAVIMMIIGIISALMHVSDIERISHAISAAFVAPLWGLLFIAAVFEPVVFVMKKRQSK